MKYQFWFIVGSQTLYGEDVLRTIDVRAAEMAKRMNEAGLLPYELVYKETVKSNEEIRNLIREANYDETCAGIITWCHTFSPSKMWINGLGQLQKPYCHLATQYNREIPNEEIDMDFMNLNQAAHGDREHGYIGARMRLARRVIAGYWGDPEIQKELGAWMHSAVAAMISRRLKVMRFGDNMREVAVTEGDKVEAQIKFGWEVNTCAVGRLAEVVQSVREDEIKAQVEKYKQDYDIATTNMEAIEYQAREEIAIRRLLKDNDCSAFVTNFQDLYGLRQLPGLAAQDLMKEGYGFGAEGDWKVAALHAVIKGMSGGAKGTTFMEYYTYHLGEKEQYTLGSHMLEVDPSVAEGKARIEVHPLGIGDREDPARVVFEGKAGDAVICSLVDMGDRMRLIVQDIHCVKPIMDMPNLPVARVMWQPEPSLKTGLECWILAGGSHHTVLSYDVTARQLKDWARIMEIEYVHIDQDTTVDQLEQQLEMNDLLWKLK